MLEEESYTSKASILVNLREIDITKATPFIFKPEQKAPENSKETFYTESTIGTTKVTKVGAKDSFSIGNLEQQSFTNIYSTLYLLPLNLLFLLILL
jgi:hypothetical protein